MKRTILVLTALATPALAHGHHSFAEYNMDVVEELQGEITSISWRNPHVQITLRTAGDDGAETVWHLEAQDVNSLGRRGLSAELVNIGDTIRVAGNTAKSGAPNMSVNNLLLPNGTEIKMRGNPKPRWSQENNIGFEQPTVAAVQAAAGNAEGLFRVWMTAGGGGFPADLPLTDAAQVARAGWDEADDPTMKCISSGMPAAMRISPPHPIDLTGLGDIIRLRVELFDIERTIHMDPGASAENQPPSELGFSTGEWDGDTLVVNTSRIDWPYFDHLASIPQSGDVDIVERFMPGEDDNQMVYEITVTDPATFTESVTGRWVMNWRPDMVVEPYECITEG